MLMSTLLEQQPWLRYASIIIEKEQFSPWAPAGMGKGDLLLPFLECCNVRCFLCCKYYLKSQ